MIDAGLFERKTDPSDARRSHVVLPQTVFEAMLICLGRTRYETER